MLAEELIPSRWNRGQGRKVTRLELEVTQGEFLEVVRAMVDLAQGRHGKKRTSSTEMEHGPERSFVSLQMNVRDGRATGGGPYRPRAVRQYGTPTKPSTVQIMVILAPQFF